MPKLTNHTFIVKTKDDHRYHFESEIHVSTDGEFSCTVPEYLVGTLDAVGKQHNTLNACRYTQKLKVNHRAYAPSKVELVRFVDEAFHEYYRAEEFSELIIGYDWFAEVSYFIRPDGTICENGTAPGAEYNSGGRWASNVARNGWAITGSGGGVKHFSVGVFAAIFKRTTFRRMSGDTVKYERVFSSSEIPLEMAWAHRLKGFTGLDQPKETHHLKQMPLTENASRFFFESMLAMCEIGRRFANFFGDEATVLAAIEGRGPTLLAPPSASSSVFEASDDTA